MKEILEKWLKFNKNKTTTVFVCTCGTFKDNLIHGVQI